MPIIVREGEIYRSIIIEGVLFEIRYGFYEECERNNEELSPIYPDFIETPMFTAKGQPFALGYQDCCNEFSRKNERFEENWCVNCIFFDKKEDYIGICRCEKKRNYSSNSEK